MTSAFEERRARTYARLEQQIAEEPDVVAVTFADRVPGASFPIDRTASVEIPSGAGPAFQTGFATSSVGPGFFEAFDRPIVAGRGFHGGDFSPAARTVIVNEAFVRGFAQRGIASPLGARLRYASESGVSAAEPSAAAEASADKPFEIVGVVRDLGLDPGEQGDEAAYVFHAASAATVSPLVMSVRLRGNPATLAARLPTIAAGVDAGLSVPEARPLGEWIWQRDFWHGHASRGIGGSQCAGVVSVGHGTLLADVDQRVAADARNRGAYGARRQPTPRARAESWATPWC